MDWIKEYQDLRAEWRRNPVLYAKQRLGLNPTWQQHDLLMAIKEPGAKVSVRSGHGVGKLLSYQTLVETPCGLRRWSDVQPGDLLFGRDGSPTIVTTRYDHKQKPFYRVTLDDGSSVEACGEHQWAVRGRQERRKKLDSWRILTTEQILEIGVKRPNGVALAKQWELPRQGPAQFEEREIDLHPYLVGIWLGDGSKGMPQYSKPYPEIADKIRSLGYEISDHSDGQAKRILNVAHLFKDGVFACGSHERYIPDEYKYNTVANRMALLEGLCDSDGEVSHSGSIGYSTTSLKLAHDVIWLARSLGCKAMMQPTTKRPWYPDENGNRVECRDCHRVTINAPFNPFTLKHRKERHRPSEHRYTTRWIESIEYVGLMDGMCVTVDAPDHLYLANDFIVTHNSSAMASAILWKLECFDFSRIPCTAPSAVQLRDVLWSEIAKWYRRSHRQSQAWGLPPELYLSALFEITQSKVSARGAPKEWFAVARTARPEQPDALQGFHASDLEISEDGRSLVEKPGEDLYAGQIMVVVEEAGGVHDKIFEVAEGALSSDKSSLLMCGNPTRSMGYFASSHKQNRSQYSCLHFRSDDSPLVSPTYRASLVRKFGEGSNVVRVRADGDFPRQDDDTLISLEDCEAALSRYRTDGPKGQRRLGCDVARFGSDRTSFCLRDGWNVEQIKIESKLDLMSCVGHIVRMIKYWKADSVHIDISGGLGAGPYDRLVELRKQGKLSADLQLIGVNVSCKAPDRMTLDTDMQPFRLRDYLWLEMRDWVTSEYANFRGVDRDVAEDLAGELASVRYRIDSNGRIVIESKAQMKVRGLRSPDIADSLGTTFFSGGVIGDGAALFELMRRRAEEERKRNLAEGVGNVDVG
jgi:phage terminase large subunit